jgi:chitinase
MRSLSNAVAIGTLLISGLLLSPASAAPPEKDSSRVVGYYTEWSIYDRKFNVADIPAAQLTHINYAFAKIHNGECAQVDSYAAVEKAAPGEKWVDGELRGSFKQLQLLKKKHPHLKTLISVGGWTLSGTFSDVALTEASRTKFAKSCVAFIVKYGFDGVDIDWEYPVSDGLESNKKRPEDKRNYTLLLEALRKELDERGETEKRRYLLTIAAPSGPKIIANFELAKIAKVVDWLNVMAYDFHGPWSDRTNFNAPLYPSKADPSKDELIRTRFNADSAVRTYLDAGVPPEKVVLGVPFYGRGWGGVKGEDGLFQPHAPNAPRGTWEAGVWDYKDLAKNYVGKNRRFWSDEAKVPWLYDEKAGVMISYDDPESLKIKAEYARKNKLGGVMIWELSADDKGALLDALVDGLREKK